ncbi:cytochrome c-type biogenesis protein [Motiliproteus sp.]|uniref:cytochrome c-type biogenesis protein n=1 Tax=Motiliproteus sp. TaxID=1898955 RepID=UPI003BAB6447
MSAMTQLRGLLLALLLMPFSAWAVIDTYEFANDQQQDQYKVLIEELRCPKCQNQNLADSNAPIAADMRREIHRMVTEGQTNQDVVDFMVARYGDFVNYRPRRDSSTLVLWYGPIGMLLLGAVVVLMLAKRKRSDKKEQQTDAGKVDRDKLQRLLDKKDD